MSSSATDEAVKKPVKTKKDSDKKKTAKKAVQSRATPVKKKKAASRKKAVTTKKAAAKKKTVKKKATRKKATANAAGKSVSTSEQHADANPTIPAIPDHTSTTAAAQGDSRSLSWMAAQAASALRAVKANQNERAQILMAKAEITPAAPASPRKEANTPIEADVSETLKDTTPGKPLEPATTKQKAKARPAGEKTQPLAESASPEAKQDTNTDKTPQSLADAPPKPGKAAAEQAVQEAPAVKTAPVKSAALVPEFSKTESAKPESVKPETVKSPAVPTAAAQPEPTVSIEQEQVSSPPTHVIANPATSGSKRSIRPMLLTGLIILVGILGARAWLGGADTADIATIQDSTATKQLSPAAAKPQHDATSVVTIKPADKPAANTTATDDWAPTVSTEWPEPTGSQEPSQTVNATTPSPAPDEAVVTETRQVQTTPQVSRPAIPQPGYYAPGYGYGNYQRQAQPQQPYYQPAYARPSYSR